MAFESAVSFQGRQYDGTGNAAQWWSDQMIERFREKAQCFIDQYNGYKYPELTPELGDNAHVR